MKNCGVENITDAVENLKLLSTMNGVCFHNQKRWPISILHFRSTIHYTFPSLDSFNLVVIGKFFEENWQLDIFRNNKRKNAQSWHFYSFHLTQFFIRSNTDGSNDCRRYHRNMVLYFRWLAGCYGRLPPYNCRDALDGNAISLAINYRCHYNARNWWVTFGIDFTTSELISPLFFFYPQPRIILSNSTFFWKKLR